MDQQVTDALRDIFDAGSGFQEWRLYCVHGVRDGRNVGIVLATKNKGYNGFALNCADWEHLQSGISNGRVDAAFVVFAKVDFNSRKYIGQWTLEEARQKLSYLEPKAGRFGKFYVIPAGLAPSEEDPWM